MKRKVMALNILLVVLLLAISTASQASSWKLGEKLNPEGKQWVMIVGRDMAKFIRGEHSNSFKGFGFGLIAKAENFVQSGSPLIIAFSPNEISLNRIEKRYRYLFIIPIDRIKEILAEDKCVIVSGKVGASYSTLIAAPNSEALKKAIARFFTLEEVPLEPLIFEADFRDVKDDEPGKDKPKEEEDEPEEEEDEPEEEEEEPY